jgi:anti-sigma B factor antagonist
MTDGSQVTLSSYVHDTGLLIVEISGDLDSHGTREIEDTLEAAIHDRSARVMVDLSQVSFLSSRGIAMLVRTAKVLKGGGGSLGLVGLQPQVAEVMKIAGFSSIFPIYPTLDDAVTSFD